MKSILKLGTRKSLLAWAQSSWVARQLERLNPGIRVELCGIETRGDRILDVPLGSVEGKEFFVAEIDEALRSREVDLTVHSMKDLSLERPPELVCGAIPERENPRDVILFGPQALARLAEGEVLKIGTSSPRRIENIPAFLEKALPKVQKVPAHGPIAQFLEIRGNVNTRLSRVQEPVDSARYLDAVVLALAGLIRLWRDPSGREELSTLLQGVRWMVLPLKECPTAPAQGALSVECRADDPFVRSLVAKLHHTETAANVSAERQLLMDWGGGCHQRFGATAIDPAGSAQDLGRLLYIRGRKPDGTEVDELRWRGGPQEDLPEIQAWDGSEWRPHVDSSFPATIQNLSEEVKGKAVFIAHSRAIGADFRLFGRSRVWTSGTSSWFKLAKQGIWVEGCAEGLGFESLLPLLRESVLQLPGLLNEAGRVDRANRAERAEWVVLTHFGAEEDWIAQGMRVIPTYKINFNCLDDAKSALKGATHLFWSSGSQYDELKEWMPKKAKHACGPGKTAAHLRRQGLSPIIFPSAEEWRRWLRAHR